MPEYGYRKGKGWKIGNVIRDAAKVVKMIFQMAAEGMSFAESQGNRTNRKIATCDERKISRGRAGSVPTV